mmetsp:Transcript_60062/g.127217  ORF Transcript_60062/g.127217 Transcript_60062/m.127217 type:complete len:439 (-) Transcript_60062:149-1465(-)|eukprot:CAMPEP_0206463370 /NCGR_PEP_ID=MMETSP0324_2-20121206/26559_1 /ASSEMBLY_ACC=CAM_ASM_000836 /TAXON_ID=2866 /ORGANISM="Crypthecodinium cohnii, Strain Seligo" /LENGTH=438 /DNA_ID=CAMNT_0053935755 /DNA_START=69 /DNA_END=1385 /DNA_ORIENTATION=+
MSGLFWSIAKDLYLVLLAILVIEQIPGVTSQDLLHDTTRKGVMTFTVLLAIGKITQFLLSDSNGGPNRQKKSTAGRDEFLEWATAEMQGWRPAMEDAVCVELELPPPLATQALFAVFDGHGGREVSRIAAREFSKVLGVCASQQEEAFREALECKDDEEPRTRGTPTDFGSPTPMRPVSEDLGTTLRKTMLTLDAFLRKGGHGKASRMPPMRVPGMPAEPPARNAFNLMGSTAIVVLVDHEGIGGNGDDGLSGCPQNSAPSGRGRPRRLTVANCGDSRALICRNGRVIELSEDHKPELQREEERIRRAGGHVSQVGPCHRIDGWGLNLSRALGDFYYKARLDLPAEAQKVVAVPEIRTLELTDEDEFLILGCDGIFELHTSQEAVDVVRASLKAGHSVTRAAEELVDASCSSNLMLTRGKGGDNCSAVVVRLNHRGLS